MPLKPQQIYVGSFYVNDDKGLVREILQDLPDENVAWRDYGLSDGQPIGNGVCSRKHMARWSTREAAEEEARLQRHVRSPSEQKREELILSIAEASLRMVSDAVLLAEVRRRGLMPEK